MLKEKLLSDTLSKIDVPNMLTEKLKPKSTSQQIKSNSKIVRIAQKHFDICKSRNITTHEILKYDLIPSANLLFDKDLTTKPIKNELIKFLSSDDYNFNKEQSSNTCLIIIHFMSQIRKLALKKSKLLVIYLPAVSNIQHQFVKLKDMSTFTIVILNHLSNKVKEYAQGKIVNH